MSKNNNREDTIKKFANFIEQLINPEDIAINDVSEITEDLTKRMQIGFNSLTRCDAIINNMRNKYLRLLHELAIRKDKSKNANINTNTNANKIITNLNNNNDDEEDKDEEENDDSDNESDDKKDVEFENAITTLLRFKSEITVEEAELIEDIRQAHYKCK